MNKTYNIYIILTYSGTMLSKMIRIYTKDEFSHVSISLDKDLKKMYSFGRLNPYNPFLAGFVHEGINFGTFKRFKNTTSEVYSLKLSENQYRFIEKLINDMRISKISYKFNILGLILVALNIKYKSKHSFYCAEFVKYLLDKADVDLGLPELVKPINFRENDKVNLVYRGILRQYTA